MTLDGLEQVIRKSCRPRNKVNFIRYADDLMSTAAEKELLTENVIPAIKDFLQPRGLTLSPEKTKIVRIEEGVDFLGQHMQKFHNKLITTPTKENTKSFLDKVRSRIRKCHGWKTEDMIKLLNPIMRGWANYHRYVQSAKTFSYADTVIFQALWRWTKRRHPKKSAAWRRKKYFNHPKRKWGFCCLAKDKRGNQTLLEVTKLSYIKLARYIKIKGPVNPFDPKCREYFDMRKASSNAYPI